MTDTKPFVLYNIRVGDTWFIATRTRNVWNTPAGAFVAYDQNVAECTECRILRLGGR